MFTQDSALAHKVKMTQGWCKTHFPDFISYAEWPPYSPDLNPMVYSACSSLEVTVCAKTDKTLEVLKQKLRQVWDRLSSEDLKIPGRVWSCVSPLREATWEMDESIVL